jgi:probable HAF family extracellular repeat protein
MRTSYAALLRLPVLLLVGGCDNPFSSGAPRDSLPPAVTIASPDQGELAARDSAVVRGTATDGEGVERLAYTLDAGAEVPVPVQPGRSVPFRFSVRGTMPGEHRLVLHAYDAAGNRGADTVVFTTASTAVRFTSPSPDTTMGAFAVRLAVTVENPVPVRRLTLSLNGGAERLLCASGGGYHYCPFQTPGTHDLLLVADALPQGEVTLTLFAYDEQGKKVGRGDLPLRVSVPVRTYDVTYLGTLGGPDSHGTDLNEKGQVVGHSATAAGATHAFVWDGGRMTDLGRGLGTESRAAAINAAGEVVGTYDADCQRAFYWKVGQEGAPAPLRSECLHGALDINDAGQVLMGLKVEGATHSDVRILHQGSYTQLRNPERGYMYSGWINDRGQVMGTFYYTTSGWGGSAWLYPDRAPEGVALKFSLVTGINDRGDYVRSCGYGQCDGELVANGRTVALAAVGRPGTAGPADVNNQRQAVGIYAYAFELKETGSVARIVWRPFLWENGTTHHVQPRDAAWEIDQVAQVNDAGVILAHGRNTATGASGAVLLRPVP